MASKRINIAIQIKNTKQILFCIRLLRYLLFFYAFLAFVLWFLNCIEVEWVYRFEKLFEIPYALVHKVYSPTGVSADYSLAIIGGVSLLLGFFFDLVSNFFIQRLDELEEEKERLMSIKKSRDRAKQQKIANEADEIKQLKDIDVSKFLFIIMPHIKKIKKQQEDIELTFQEVEVWKQRVNKKFMENVLYSKPLQKGYYRKNLFLLYKDFNYVDDFIYYIRPTLDSIMLEFKKYGISVSFCFVLSALAIMQYLEKELDMMDTILFLNFINEFIVTKKFKISYDNMVRKRYDIVLKGEYNLSKNLSITNKQPLYKLTDKAK